MPKSLLLITGIFPPDSGGPSKFAIEFGIWASQKKVDVTVQTYSDNQNPVAKVGTVRVSQILRSRALLFRYAAMIRGIRRNLSPNISVLAVGAFLETYLSSIIYGFSYVVKVPGDIVWERARNNNVTDLGIVEFQLQKLNFKYRVFRKLYSNSLKKARIVIVPSRGLFNLCIQWGVLQKNIRLIYNSVEPLELFEIPTSEYKFDLVTICRLAPWKGVDELIQYSAKRNLSLVVAGDGPDRARLEALTKTLGAKVTFMGEISTESVNQLLSESRIFVLNSYYEGLPHALVEARVAGLISVGRAGTGSAEVINDDIDGYLIRPDRPLDATLDLAISSVTKSNDFIQRAKNDASSRFNKEINFNEISKIIQGKN
jgi:glycosyltransferase involved in cell wall biosynthesis